MIVVRLVVLAVLGYIAWMLLRSIVGRGNSRIRVNRADKDDNGARVQDVLVEDPVCHRLVPKHQAIRLRKNKKNYYFCSEECCDRFSERPRGDE